MKGYVKTNDFPAFNTDAGTRIKAAYPEADFEDYTFSTPDTDPAYKWARVEEQWTATATPEELALVKTKDEAIADGMVEASGEI